MPRTIAIVGAGFSGAMLTAQLLRQSSDTRIILIGDKGFGRGQAYSTTNPAHLLNVRADNMSAWPDEPGHFLAWLRETSGEDGSGRFIGRARYGAYVRHNLAQALRDGGRRRVRLLRGHVQSISPGAPHLLTLADGQTVQADRVVLATGNFPPSSLPAIGESARSSPIYCADPWAQDVTARLAPDAPVLLIGTGLTMVDVVISLLRAGHQGPIHCLSRHGALPLPHTQTGLPPEPCAAEGGLNVLLHDLRRNVRSVEAQGGHWQQAVDGLRPHTIPIWQRLTPTERRRFLRHPRRLWEVHRHRMAPEIAAQIDAARRSGQLTLLAGHLRRLDVDNHVATARFQPRGGGAEQVVRAARVINCAGPASDFRTLDDPLLRQLLDSRQVRPDPCRLGFDVAPNNALVANDGTVSETLFAIGPMTKAAFWEIVAVPDIRRQSRTLAETLLA